MPDSQNDIPDSQLVPTNVQKEANTYEDEINLIGYFRVLWKRKYFVVLGSVLPALVVGLVIFFGSRSYKMTYVYGIEADEKGCKTLPGPFYSAENLGKLTSKLKENGLDKYAQEIGEANIQLEISPSYFESYTAKTTNIKNLQEIQQVKGTLLTMTIVGKPKKDMQRISSIVRDNFEKVLPIYNVKQKLNSAIVEFKARMADIEENRFSLELELGRKKAILAKLKNLKPADSNRIPSGIVLQFDNVAENSEYLPLAYQIQATDANIIDLEESIRANQKKYDYYKGLLSLNERLFGHVRNKISSYYTIQEFHAFLTNIVSDCEDKELIDYLNAYIKKIENAISTNIAVVEEPRICLIPKGTINKTVIVFVMLLMITTLGAFLLEGIPKSQAQASRKRFVDKRTG
jgi:hypothetical protein